MAHHQRQHHNDNHTMHNNAVILSNGMAHSEPLQVPEEEVAPDIDEPPDHVLMFKRQPIRSPALSVVTDPLLCATEATKRQSLLTRGLSSEGKSTTLRPRSVVSSYSNDSIVSTADLTSDGGLTSPARTTTPSPPLSLTTTNLNILPPQLHKTDTVIYAPQDPPKKRCITFACGKPPVKQIEVQAEKKTEISPVKKPCTIKFACPAKPIESTEDKKISDKATIISEPSIIDTPKKLTTKASFSRSPVIPKTKRRSDALRFHEFASKHLEEDEWVHENPRRLSKLTISDTLRKENEYRKLGEEAAAEALEAELEEDEKAMAAEDDEEINDSDEDLEDDDDDEEEDNDEAEDDEDDTDGNESDNEAGFAESDDDEAEDDSDYQFWTTGVTTAATSADYLEHIRSRNRSESASSIDSVVPNRSHERTPTPKLKKRHRAPRMRPATPELPDSTDFVCGTLDEDRPLEAAYIACIAQRKLAKQGILPQDLDPTFPTSDPEQDESDKEDEKKSDGSHDNTWAAGRFDDFEINNHRGGRQNKHHRRSPSVSPKRVKSPCPQTTRNRVLAHTPPPTRRLFGQSPKHNRSPATSSHPMSPQTSRRPSFEDKTVDIPRLAQRPNTTQTKSLPRTPNPFWKEHRRQRKDFTLPTDESNAEMHSRGPIDIVQGLEDKRRRRKEKFWLTHYRKEAKEKEKGRRRQPPGRGAKRMRELGLEAADRCKGYGQRLQLVLSV